MSNENGQDFEEKDDHMVQFIVSKAEERQAGSDLSSDKISQQQYTEVLSRIYRVLAGLYREAEMKQQVAQEWIYDLHGATEMDQNLFTKFLFRIAHQWCTSIDLDEYCELLDKVFDRITMRQIVRGNGKVETALPQISVTINQDVQAQADESDDEAAWEECDEDDEETEEYEYKTETEDGILKRFRRQINAPDDKKAEKFLSSRDPFYYNETVVYHQPDSNDHVEVASPSSEDFVTQVLAEHRDIFPMGYPTEQYLCWMKNDVHKAQLFIKQEKKAVLTAMQRDLFAGTQSSDANRPPALNDKDRGLLPVNNQVVSQHFSMHRVEEPVRVITIAQMLDSIYNQFREMLKDTTQLSIRASMENPKKNKKDLKNSTDLSVPLKRKSAFGHNPTLERRLNYRMSTLHLPGQTQPSKVFVNTNYLIVDPVFDTAYRSDVTKIETSEKMSIKPSDEFTREEDFCNVVTTFRDSVQIMLQKKYETFFTVKLQGDSKEAIERDNKIYSLERNRKGAAYINEKLSSKAIQEKFEASSNAFLKAFRGPFYKLQSKAGPLEDDFKNTGTHDLLQTVNQETHRVLIVGKPRSGKTTLAKQLEKRLNLTRVSADVWIQNLFKKIKDREDNPPEEEPEPVLEEGQEPPPKKSWLLPLEESVLNKLKSGGAPSDEEIDQMIKELIQSPEARTRGFVLDLDFSHKNKKSWIARIQDARILSDPEFTHIVDLLEDKSETLKRAQDLRQTPTDGVVYSKWERNERNKPKKPANEDEPEEEEDENAPKPLIENELISRECDDSVNINKDSDSYERRDRDQIDAIISKLFHSDFIKLQSAGLTPDEIAESVVYRLKRSTSAPLVPVATLIEGGGSFKDLLTQDIDSETGQLPRQWSLWRTTDPVALFKGKVQPGLPEFAAHYANNVFVFSSEENLKNFIREPRIYLTSAPKMPTDFRCLLLGPKGAGVPEQARLLESQYGWRIVDFPTIVKNKLADILAFERKPPNNITQAGPCMIGLSQEELQEIKDGKTFATWKFLPWVLEFLGVPLSIAPKAEQTIVEPDLETMNEEEKKNYEKEQKKKAEEKKKKDKEEDDLRKTKEDRARRRAEAIEAGQDLAEVGLEESEEEVKIEDLSITRFMTARDANGNNPKFGQFVMYGFPQTEIHINKLKEFGFAFDRVCYFNDTTEEEPGREIKQRMAALNSDMAFDWEDENARAQKIFANYKEFMGEEGILEVDCTGKMEDVFIKLRTKLDPFFLLCDNIDDVRTSADLNLGDEENPDKRLSKSDFGDFCPVTYVKHGFIVKGQAEQESILYGKTYRFATEEDKKEFEFNPTKFLQGVTLPLAPPPPKIMIIGVKGAGVSTQISMLCNKFKIESLDLMTEFLKQTKIDKEKRKRARLLARGFKAIPEPENEDEEPQVDPEIEEEGEGFDPEADAVRVFQSILKSNKALVINGNWTTLPEGAIELALDKLLTDSKRAPEILIVLKCKEKTTFDRCIDDKKIRAELENDNKKRDQAIKLRRENERKTKLQELTEEIKIDEENDERKTADQVQAIIAEKMKEYDDEQEGAENPEEEVADYATRREEVDNKMKEQLDKDAAFLESFVEGIKGEDTLNQRVVVCEPINTDISADYVHIKILEKIKNHMQYRTNLIEREQAQILKPAEIKFYEASYTYRHSKFGRFSPLSPSNPCVTKDFAVLYRERIYFLNSKVEQTKFLLEPSKYTLGKEPVPLDIEQRPSASVIGLPASGKSTLASIISSKTGMVHLRPEEIIEFFINKESHFSEKLRKRIQIEGSEVDDTTLIDMLAMRTHLSDCLQRGWVLDGFPQNRIQAIQMTKLGINPDIVFHVQVPINEIYKRTEATQVSDFSSNRNILVRRLVNLTKNIPQTSFFYQKYYNSLVSVNGLKSRWFMEDLALNQIEKLTEARFQFARNLYFKDRPCILENLNYDRSLVKQSLSQYGYICPVSWKVNKKFVNCTQKPENAVLYQDKFYYFASKAERDIFVKSPSQFTERVLFCQDRNVPKRYRAHKAAEIVSQEKSLLGHCPVSLKDEERVEKGYQLTVVSFKDNRFIFASEEKATRFFQNPARYANIQLPVKMPPIKDPVLLYKLQKQDDSITFMEQALGQVVTRGLREVGENRLKYPTLSVKETMLKLFAIFLKAENPANTAHMREKYRAKMKEFIYRCEVPQELHELSHEKKEKQEKNRNWPQFKEDYYNKLGEKFDQILQEVPKEMTTGFASYIK